MKIQLTAKELLAPREPMYKTASAEFLQAVIPIVEGATGSFGPTGDPTVCMYVECRGYLPQIKQHLAEGRAQGQMTPDEQVWIQRMRELRQRCNEDDRRFLEYCDTH